MHQFSGSTIEEALQAATAELGRDITVVRARRVTSKRTLGLGSKVRFEVDVLAGTQTPPVEASSGSGGPFDGLLAGLIDNIERLEADQHRGTAAAATGSTRSSGSTGSGETTRRNFGEADLAPSAGGYGPRARAAGDGSPADRRPNVPGGTAGGGAGVDLRPVRAEVDDDVLAALADGRRGAGAPSDVTPSAARLARAATARPGTGRSGTERQARDGAGGTGQRPARPVRAVPPQAPPAPGADALARAARLAAERAVRPRVDPDAVIADLAGGFRPEPTVEHDAELQDEWHPGDAAAERIRREAQRQADERRSRNALHRHDDEHAAREQADRARAEQVLNERRAAERAEAAQAAAARIEAERRLAEQAETERRLAEQAELERADAERARRLRLAAERVEAERVAAERVEAERREREAERLAATRAEAERLEAERREREAAEIERAEAERAEAERRLAERREAELREAARLEVERALAERDAAARAEAERLEVLRAEAERVEAEQLQAMRAGAEQARRREIERQAEQRRLAEEQLLSERLRAERAEAEAAAMRRRLEMERDVAEAWLASQRDRRFGRPAAAASAWSRRATPVIDEDIVEAEWTTAEPVIDLVEVGTPDRDGRSGRRTDGADGIEVLDASDVVIEPDAPVAVPVTPEQPSEPGAAGSDAADAEPVRGRRSRRRRREMARRERSAEPVVAQPVGTGTAVELARPWVADDGKRSAGLMSSLSPSRGMVHQPVGQMELTNRVLSFGLDPITGAEVALGGEPQWSLDHLAAIGMPPVALEMLGRLELRSDADWMSAVEKFIREHVPAPVSDAVDASGVFLSGADVQSAGAIIRAGLLGFVPGYIYVEGQFRLASSIELMLAVRSCLPR